LDLDSNNEVSIAEINEAINGFFDGENELTPAKLTDLINYFFE
jgi:hypothetical protein